MCTNCLPHRNTQYPQEPWPPRAKVVRVIARPVGDTPRRTKRDTRSSSLADAVHTLISRRQLLQVVGGGALGLALTMGFLGRTLRRAAVPDHLVLIVLDGARPEYLNVPGIPTVQSLIRNGALYTNAFAGILESETTSGHVSIATGSDPRVHGVLGFWWGDDNNQEISLFDPEKIRAGVMDDIIRQSGAPTLAGLVHAKRSTSKVVALSGHKYYAADALSSGDADLTMYYYGTPAGSFVPIAMPRQTPPAGILDSPGLITKNDNIPLGLENHLAMKLAVDTFKRMRQQVTLINLPEFDWPLGHVDGGSLAPSSVTILMQRFDRDLAMLQDAYRRAGVLDRTLFVLLADHGMMPLSQKVDNTVLQAAVANAGTKIVSESYSSGAYLWLEDSSRASQAAQNIANLRSPAIQSVYVAGRTKAGYAYHHVSDGSLQRTAAVETANQYLLSTFAGANGPDVVVAFTEGAGSEPGGQAGWKADHGGTSWEAQHIPLVISGPGVRSGVISSYPARLIDVAPTVLQLMSISPNSMQGAVLADVLESPPASATYHQRANEQKLRSVVQALQQESRLEMA